MNVSSVTYGSFPLKIAETFLWIILVVSTFMISFGSGSRHGARDNASGITWSLPFLEVVWNIKALSFSLNL